MIKAEYRGIDDKPLYNGKLYKISTKCIGGRLLVSVGQIQRSYSCLEQFLKDWRIRAVYEQSRDAKKSKRGK